MKDFMFLFPFGLILIIGVLTSYTDIVKHKIKNLHIALGGTLGLIYYTIFFIFNKSLPNLYFLANLAIAFILSFFLYLFRIWPAGDAKLFLLFAFLFFHSNSLNLFPSLFLFLNIAITGMLLIGLELIFEALINPLDLLKTIFNKKNLISFGYLLIIAFSISWSRSFLIKTFPFLSNITIALILYLIYGLIYKGIEKIKKKIWLLILIFLIGIFLRFLLEKEIFFNFSYFTFVFKHTLIFIGIYFILFKTKEKFFTRRVKLDKIHPRKEIAADDIYDKENKLIIKKGEILTLEKLNQLKELFKNKKIDSEKIPAKKAIAFAPIIFLGTILSYTNFLIKLLKLFNNL